MSFHHPMPLTSRQAAVENLPADPKQHKKMFDDLFADQDRQREEIQAIIEARKVRTRESAMRENLGVEDDAIRAMKMWRRAFLRNEFKASVAFAQFMLFANAQGWPQDREAPQDETPVMDRTKTGRRLLGMNPQREGARPGYGITARAARQHEANIIAERLYQKLRSGVPADRLREGEGAGRPSNTWLEAYDMALARFNSEEGSAAA